MLLSLLFASAARAADPNGPAATADDAREAAPPVSGDERRSPLRGDARLVGFVATPFSGGDGSAGLGFGLGTSVGWGRIPLLFGVDVMPAYFSDRTSRIEVQAGDTLLAADRTRTDLGYFLDASLRLQPIDWWIRPYFEGVVGTKLLETKYSLSFVGSGTSTSTVTDHDWAGSIGWGVGVDLGIAGMVGLTLGLRRLSGADASFSRVVDAGDNVTVRYSVPTSTTLFMLGLSQSFGGIESSTPTTGR